MKQRAGPMNSARWVRKAITSCLVTRSISSMRATLNLALLPLSQIAFAAPGTVNAARLDSGSSGGSDFGGFGGGDSGGGGASDSY